MRVYFPMHIDATPIIKGLYKMGERLRKNVSMDDDFNAKRPTEFHKPAPPPDVRADPTPDLTPKKPLDLRARILGQHVSIIA